MKAWEQFLKEQEAELGDETVEKWLRTLDIQRFDACNLYLKAKDSFQALWFEEHIRPKVLTKLYNNNQKQIRVHLSVSGSSNSPAKNPPSKNPKTPPSAKAASFSLQFDGLDPLYTFEQLITTPSNELTVSVLKNMCENFKGNDSSFNPIYICGPKGTGKSHLLMATCEALSKKGARAIYSRAETFTEHVITAIRAGEMSLFRNAYRHIDVLLIDDLQGFGRKAATQEEFFHTFNTLHLGGKQIVLAANVLPQALQAIEPRLTSRFEWGIVLPLENHSRTDLMQMIHARATAMDCKLHPKVAAFLLDTFQSGASALMKALQALILRSHLNNSQRELPTFSPSFEQAKHLLQDLIAEELKAVLTPERIVTRVAEYFGIRTDDILKKGQTRDCVMPRHISMYFCRMELKLPFTKIGHFFQKDHSTVISSVKLIQGAIANQVTEVTDPLNAIKRRLHE